MTSDPNSPRYRFGIRFSLLVRRWRQSLDAHLAQAGQTGATWVPLVHLQETGGGISQKQLARLVGVDGSSLVRVLDINEREGLIERRRDEHDGRARLIFLTAKGRQRVAEIRAELFKVEEAILADLSDDDLTCMIAQFDRIEARLKALEEGPRPGDSA
ncbi:MAG: transcriptional regulator [Rhodobacteraceae bacterium]|nr:transcriptional regulator [Paracoccaceae bacterium]MAY48045.1 transcriptional regulator [Paracoccaceae bacterium]QEW20122.1 Salmolysin [Marinibacterium anthonyi]